MNWIKCSERLPSDDGKVPFLICANGEVPNTVYYFTRQDCEPYLLFFPQDDYGYRSYSGKDVTHWMPLPAPPKKGD